jgi:hypothetical protein
MNASSHTPSFKRLDAQCILVEADSGGMMLRYTSDEAFQQDLAKMADVVNAIAAGPPGVDPVERRALVEAVALHRLFLLNRGLVGPKEAFSKSSILDDPEVYRTVLDELDSNHDHDREQTVPLLARFFGLDEKRAQQLAAADDAFEGR